MSRSITIKHAGDLGDIIYFLPVARSYAEDSGPVTFMLDPGRAIEATGNPKFATRQPMTCENAAPLIPLLQSQPYIGAVLPYNGDDGVDVDGNAWRDSMFRLLCNPSHFHSVKHINLCDWQRRRYGIDQRFEDEPWILDIEPAFRGFDIIINRTARYQNPHFPWRNFVQRYDGRIGFIGLPEEHRAFREAFGDVPHVPSEDLLEAARIIRGSKLFIGNQSACYAIAEGLKHPAVLEVYPEMPNCKFGRPDGSVIHGTDRTAFEEAARRFKL